MILEPGILALLVGSVLASLMTLYACWYGVKILRHWDIASGSELQLSLERRTYLVSSVVSYFLIFQLVSLFLYIRTADSICHLFVGAMCAVGTLSANGLGYPTLVLKTATFILAGLWLILNHADNQGYDYPLIRPKYLLLLVLTPFILIEAVLQALFFFRLSPDIITSCCGSLFIHSSPGIASEILSAPGLPMAIVFYSCTILTLGLGLRLLLRGKGACLFAGMSGVGFGVSLVSVVSFISLYIYEMPSHHCPFCLLQKEYGYIGYPLYLLVFLCAVSGIGVGLLHPFRNRESLREVLPSLQRRLAAVSMASSSLFTCAVTWKMLSSNLSLLGF